MPKTYFKHTVEERSFLHLTHLGLFSHIFFILILVSFICEKNDLIWGGETSVKNIEMSELEKLFKKYIKYIYDKIGDKNVEKQVSKKMSSYIKKKKRGCFS